MTRSISHLARFGALVALIAAPAAMVAGCGGFQPLYGKRGAATNATVSANLADVQIDQIADRSGQILRNMLLDRMNPAGEPASPRYRLSVLLTSSKNLLGIRRDETATRANMNISANFSLTEIASGVVVYRSRMRTTTSYNVVDEDFSTIMSERDAVRRGVIQVADGITLRLALYFNRRRTAAR